MSKIVGIRQSYLHFNRQKCFVGHSKDAEWLGDIQSACDMILPKFNLEPYYATDHFDPTTPLRDKVVDMIANSRFGIYDISYWRDPSSMWQMPRNVLIELGIAVAINRPTLLARHTSNDKLALPSIFEGLPFVPFAGETTLAKALDENLQVWAKELPEQDWASRYCILGNRGCEFRTEHPRMGLWGRHTLSVLLSDGLDADSPHFNPTERDETRDLFSETFRRYSDIEVRDMNGLQRIDGFKFLLCSRCQGVRSSPFAIHRITSSTTPDVYIAIGIAIALEYLFGYKIPTLLIVRNEQELPSLLRGYEVIEAATSREIKQKLTSFIPGILHKVRETAWKSRALPFASELSSLQDDEVDNSSERIKNGTQQNLQSLNLDQFLAEWVHQLSQDKKYSSVQFNLELSRGPRITVLVNPEWLLVTLQHILDNAYKAVAGSGEITIRTASQRSFAEIQIQDSGPGIPEAIRALLFKQPVEVSRKAEISGQGLFIARQIVKYYDGEIRIMESGPDGTTIVIQLPLQRSDTRSATVLVVENDVDLARTTQEFLELEGYNVLVAVTLDNARTLVTRNQFDLVILGLRLVNNMDPEDLSGLTLAQEPLFKNIPKILWSAFPTHNIVRDALRIQSDGNSLFQDAVSKSQGFDALLLAIKKVLSETLPVPKAVIQYDSSNRMLLVNEREVHLSPGESAIFEYLLKNRNRVCTTEELISVLMASEPGNNPYRRLMEYLTTLRSKLNDDGPTVLVEAADRGWQLRALDSSIPDVPLALDAAIDRQVNLELIKYIERALEDYQSIPRLVQNPLTRLLDLQAFRKSDDPPEVADGWALRRALDAGIDAITGGTPSADKPVRLEQYLHLRYRKRIPAKDIAAELNYSQRHLQRLRSEMVTLLARTLVGLAPPREDAS